MEENTKSKKAIKQNKEKCIKYSFDEIYNFTARENFSLEKLTVFILIILKIKTNKQHKHLL